MVLSEERYVVDFGSKAIYPLDTVTHMLSRTAHAGGQLKV